MHWPITFFIVFMFSSRLSNKFSFARKFLLDLTPQHLRSQSNIFVEQIH